MRHLSGWSSVGGVLFVEPGHRSGGIGASPQGLLDFLLQRGRIGPRGSLFPRQDDCCRFLLLFSDWASFINFAPVAGR
jgi:hypothetical protein